VDQRTLARTEARINRRVRTGHHQPTDPVGLFLSQFRRQGGMRRKHVLTRAALASLPPLASQEPVADPIARVKFFTPDSSWAWYATEAGVDRDENGTILDVTFYGYVVGPFPELGYFALRELAALRGPLGLPVERDLSWRPIPLSLVQAEHHR